MRNIRPTFSNYIIANINIIATGSKKWIIQNVEKIVKMCIEEVKNERKK